MIAVLLNSGVGSRMGELTRNKPKCMVEIGEDRTILSNQIDTLRELGVSKFVITTGHMADVLRGYLSARYPAADLTYVHNDRYLETNYIVSLYNAIPATQDDILLLHGDLVFTQTAARAVLGAPGSVVAVDSTLPLPEKDFKARMAPDGRVREIGVGVFGADCLACQPFYKLEKRDWLLWQRSIEDFCARGIETVYAENALNAVAGDVRLFGLDMKGELCMEADNQQDLAQIRAKLA